MTAPASSAAPTARRPPARDDQRPGRAGLTGTPALIRLAVRRDRIALPAWILALSALLALFTAMFVSGMPEQRDVVREAEMMAGNPGLRMIGLASGATYGGITLIRGYTTLAVLAALMSTLAVVRHTRQNEETGRAELLGATVVGRYASLASAIVVTAGANVLLTVMMALAMIVNGQPVAGSFAAGASFGAVGLVFGAVAAVTAQLASTTRGANGFAAAAIGIAFLIAGAGNMLGNVDGSGVRVISAWPVWLSPLGWGQQIRPFDGAHWWLLVPFAVLFAVLAGVAGMLVGRRDVGKGIVPERLGHAEAPRALLSPYGLVWRLQRGVLLGWGIGMLGFGLIFGSISDEATNAQGSALEWYKSIGAGIDQLVDGFRASMIQMAGLGATIYVVQMLLRMRAEEADGPLEPILATAVGRPRWALSHIVNACLGAAALVLVFAVSMALTGGAAVGDTAGQLRDLTAAALAQLPAVLVIGAVVVAMVGLLPRWAGPVSWTVLVLAIVCGPTFGASLKLPGWARDISPFTHLPLAPVDDITLPPLTILLVASVLLGAAGLAAARRRNLLLPA